MIPPLLLSRSLLRGADELGLRKAVKAEFGGGTRSFSCEEDFIYENVENELRFFTSQVRQLGPQLIFLTPSPAISCAHALFPAGAPEHHPLLASEPACQAG